MLLANDLSRALDPTLFAADCGLPDLDPWQSNLLRNDPARVLLLASRQAGKSSTVSIKASHLATTCPGSLILVLSPSQNQSAELLRSIKLRLTAVGTEASFDAESVLRCQLRNGSRIISLPGSPTSARGYAAADLIILDEASRIDDELITAVKPILATSKNGGQFWALTTPAGRRGWFHEQFMSGDPLWTRVCVPASECPRISPQILEEARRELGELRFRQEFMCEFVDDNVSAFNVDLIRGALSSEVKPRCIH